jgi:hypothetical protein
MPAKAGIHTLPAESQTRQSASFFEKKEAKKLGAVPDPMIIALP